MAFTSAYCNTLPAPNSTITRFDARYWHLDFPLSAISTIIADSPDELTVHSEFRSNRNLTGLLWSSYDRTGHPMLQYMTDYDYRGTILAFAANPLDPYTFTLTATVAGAACVYRLYPYKVDGQLLVPDTSGKGAAASHLVGNGPNTSYAISKVFPDGLPSIPDGYQYYIIDFDDLRMGYNFDGNKIDSSNISEFFISITPTFYGIGTTAMIANVGSMSYFHGGEVLLKGTDTVSYYHLTGVEPNLRLTRGDILQLTLVLPDQYKGMTHSGIFHKHPKPIYSYKVETIEIEVTEWYGDGTSERFIKIQNGPLENMAWFGGRAQHVALQNDTAIGSESLMFNMRNMTVTGARATIGKRDYPSDAHNMQMTSGYDDTYNISPWRQVETSYKLGYRGHFDMYMGMSHYFKAYSTGGNQSFTNKVIKDADEPLNGPTEQWCRNLFKHLAERNYTFIWSTSFEILASYMPEEWAQRDYSGAMALSGWMPPSSFVIPSYTAPLDYLARVIKHGLKLIKEAGITELYFQIGEPWWWDGSYTNGAPCIYDDYTRALYKRETGNDVPTPYYENYSHPVTDDQRPYLEWVGSKLGQATNYIRDKVKEAYPESMATLLFFTPQIMNPASEMLPIINFPASEWVYPNYDFVQIEDYDWISEGRLELLPLTLEAATVRLKYPLEVVHYFIGFVNTARETWVWPNINIATKQAIANKIPNIYVWAYPQVVRDGILYDNSEYGMNEARLPELPRTRQLPREIEANIVRPVFMLKAGDDIYLNSGDKDIQYNGHTWQSAITFGTIESFGEGIDDEESGWQMTLAHVPLDQINYVTEYLRKNTVSLYVALLSGGNQMLADPRRIGQGYVYDTSVSTENNTATFTIKILSKLSSLHRRVATKYTDNNQTSVHPDDRGFMFVNGLSELKLKWGAV